jgi:hypothetical protein
MNNEEFVRHAYEVAEVKDIPGWIACFNPDGVFTDNSVGITCGAPDEVAYPVQNYGRAFSNMHRELYDVYLDGDIVVVQLALQGTHDGGPGRCGVGTPRWEISRSAAEDNRASGWASGKLPSRRSRPRRANRIPSDPMLVADGQPVKDRVGDLRWGSAARGSCRPCRGRSATG